MSEQNTDGGNVAVETKSSEEIIDPKAASTRKRLKIIISVFAVILVVVLAIAAWVLYLGPQRNAQSLLDGFAASRGNITAVNSSMATFSGQKIADANVKQKGLAEGGKLTTPPAFIFTNGKKDADRKVLDFYFDFSDQRSRDALISNANSLRGLTESGQIELRLHPLFGGRAYSMYASEALSEIFASDKDHAWDSLMVLLRNAPEYADSDSKDEIVKGMVSSLKTLGVSSVDSDSIKNGTFASWLLSIGNDPRLSGANGPKLPYILLNDRQLNLSADQLNNSDSFKRELLKEIG